MVTFWLFWTVGIFNHLYCAYYSFNYYGFFNSTGFSANLMHKKRLSLSTNRLHKHTDNFKNMYQFCVLLNTARLICSTNSQSGGEFRQFLSKESRTALPTLTHSAHFTWQQWGINLLGSNNELPICQVIWSALWRQMVFGILLPCARGS